MHDGTSHTLLVAESSGAQAACADADGDGIVFLSLLAHDPQSGDQVVVTFTPTRGEIDAGGEHEVRMEIGDNSFTGMIDVALIDLAPREEGRVPAT